ncbi:MAG TPA: transposase [Stellaceae bacterium]|jgi:transposase|nr:transposase [Stellaceae bacterium]
MALSSAPIDLRGDWGESPPEDAALVITRLHATCLAGVDLPSDRQPDRLKVEGRVSTVPHIWLDGSNPTAASVVIDGSGRNWCRLSYQLGHELGHVVCNSWDVVALPLKPSQWLEECLAEAFSLRGLARLADSWDANPVLTDHPDYGKHLRRYRELTIAPYRRGGPPSPLHSWFAANRVGLENGIGGRPSTGPALLMILSELDRDAGCVADLGAVNRWPSRAAAPLEDYLEAWQQSCAETGTPGYLPVRIRDMLFFDEPAPSTYHRPPQLNLQHPNRGEVREQVVAVDDLVALDHPVRSVWAMAEGLDLSAWTGAPGEPARPAPALFLALWLWATIEGIGSARHIARLCEQRLAYRWLCGGVAIDPEMLISFRHASGIEPLLARSLAALTEERIITLELLAPEALTAQRLTGPSPARRRRRLRALAEAATTRLHTSSTTLDREDPIADEHLMRTIAGHAARQRRDRIGAVLARVKEFDPAG